MPGEGRRLHQIKRRTPDTLNKLRDEQLNAAFRAQPSKAEASDIFDNCLLVHSGKRECASPGAQSQAYHPRSAAVIDPGVESFPVAARITPRREGIARIEEYRIEQFTDTRHEISKCPYPLGALAWGPVPVATARRSPGLSTGQTPYCDGEDWSLGYLVPPLLLLGSPYMGNPTVNTIEFIVLVVGFGAIRVVRGLLA